MQNSELRIILGAMKSTPITDMETMADVQPLESRRNYKILCQAEKASRLPTHPLSQILGTRNKNRLQRKSLNHLVRDAQKHLCLTQTQPEALEARMWQNPSNAPTFRTDIPGLKSKGEHLPHDMLALTLEMIDHRYPPGTWTHVYTDGSADRAINNGGSGVYVKHTDGTAESLHEPVGSLSTNYGAELHALNMAAEHILSAGSSPQGTVFLTDSLSALQSLQEGPTDKMTTELWKNLLKLSDKTKVTLQWIPAHTGIAGNEIADSLAKAGSRLPQPPSSLSYREAKTILKQTAYKDWPREGYDFKTDGLHSLGRKAQTTVFRLRTGHCRLNKHMRRMSLSDSASCPCGAQDQTPIHVLQTCPLFEEARTSTWEEDTPFHTKLWGSSTDLMRTANFASTTGLKF